MTDAPTAQSGFDEFMKGAVAPSFKDAGFRRKGGNFHRERTTCIHVVNYQKSYYSDRREIRFTINVGVASKRLWAFFHWGEAIPTVVPEPKCHLRQRIGRLMGTGDTWWQFGLDSDIVSLRREHEAIIRSAIVPWLDRYGSDDGLVELALKRDPHPQSVPIYDAVLLHTPATLSEFEAREDRYRTLAETNGSMEWVLGRLDEERATWR